MSLPVRRPEPQRRQFAVNADALVREVTALEGVERIGQLDTPLSEIRERIERLHAAGLIELEVRPDRWVFGVNSGDGVDWRTVFHCGHVSAARYVKSAARTVSCYLCDEVRVEAVSATDALEVLRHVESVHLSRSGAATAITSRSERG